MSNPNLLGAPKPQLFASNIPMRKSIIIVEDVFVTDMDKQTVSNRTIRRKTQMFEPRKSSFMASNIMYPGPMFLVVKVKRILQAHLGRAFKKIRDYKKTIVNLNLLQAKSKRYLASAFFSLKLYDKLHKGEKLGQVITRNKRPHLLYHEISRVVKRRYKEVLIKLVNLKRRRQNVDDFLGLIHKITKNQIKPYFANLLFRKMKENYSLSVQKMQGATNLYRIIPKIIRRIKQFAFRSIISGLKAKQLEKIALIKKDSVSKMNETTTQRARALAQQRQKIRNVKNSLDLFSADRSKARYEIRRDINSHRNKLKQEEKKAKTVINELTSQVKALENQLQQFRHINAKRLGRIQNLKGVNEIQDIFQYLQNLQVNQLGQIKPKEWPKQKFVLFNRQLQGLDEYHTYKNQKLRLELFQYENLTSVKKGSWPIEQLIIEENTSLKQMIKCIISRKLEKKMIRGSTQGIQN